MKSILKGLHSFLVIAIPLLVALTAVRLALSPIFVTFEYQRPGFPPDSFGFSTAERLYWSQYSIDYLLGKVSHEALSDQTLQGGSPLFNARELAHMQDVRDLTRVALIAWQVSIGLFTLVFLLSLLKKDLQNFVRSIRRGVLFTITLIGLILLLVLVNFDLLFTKFHEIFFEGDTWLFYPSDNLIRLFPLPFWRDLFIFIGGASLLICACLYFCPTLIRRLNIKRARK